MGFTKLISIENMKLWKRASSKVMLVIMILLAIAVPSMMKIYQHTSGNSNSTEATAVDKNWKAKMQQELSENEKQLDEIKKSSNKSMKSNQGYFEKKVAENKYYLDHNIAPSQDTSIWQMVTDLDSKAGFGSFIGLMVIIACTAQVAGEFSEGTMKMMISRPYSRKEILSAKLLSQYYME